VYGFVSIFSYVIFHYVVMLLLKSTVRILIWLYLLLMLMWEWFLGSSTLSLIQDGKLLNILSGSILNGWKRCIIFLFMCDDPGS
jgi:hypothetical protein